MKICQISTAQTRHHARIFHRMSRSLARAGYEVVILCADGLPDEVLDGVTIKSVSSKPMNRFHRMFIGNNIYRAAIRECADVYQVNAPENLPVALLLKWHGRRVIFDSHEDHPANITTKTWIPHHLRRIIAMLYGLCEKMVVSRLDAALAPAAHVASRLKKINSNSYLVTNYPIIEQAPSAADHALAVCFVGNVTKDDNHTVIIKALTKIPGLRYRMVIWEENKYIDELRLLAKSLAVDDRVDILPRMPQCELPKFHSTAMAGIITRRYTANYGFKRGSEGIIKFYEYMANSLPVVCSDYDIWRQIINTYDCGICVDPDSVSDLVQALGYLVANPERAKQMGANARRAAVERYNWSTQVEIYLDAYSNVIKGSGAECQ